MIRGGAGMVVGSRSGGVVRGRRWLVAVGGSDMVSISRGHSGMPISMTETNRCSTFY